MFGQDVGRFRAAVFETDAAQLDAAFQTVHWLESRAVASLLRFLFENVVQPIQQNGGELHVVPHPERPQDSAVSHRGQRTESDKSADAEASVMTWFAPTQRKIAVESIPIVCSTLS